MNNKEWLSRGWKVLDEILVLEAAKEKAVKLAGSEAGRLTAKIKEKQRELMRIYLQILKAIYRIENRADRQILQLRYLANCTHEEIALIMGYEETRSVARRIDKASERIVQCR